MSSPLRTLATRRSARLLAWAAAPVLVLAGFVQVTGVGIDILLVAGGGLILLSLQRSVGDWLAEWVGPFAAAGIFGGAAVALPWYFLSSALGKPQTDRFFVEAQRRGYQTVFYKTSARADVLSSAYHAAPAHPVATGGRGVAPAPRRGEAHSAVRATTSRRPGPEPKGSPASAIPRTENHPQAKEVQGAGSTGSLSRQSSAATEPIATTVSIDVSPATGHVARRVVITAFVRAGAVPVTKGTVDFTVNGQGAGRVQLTAAGAASATFLPNIPGTYEVHARYSGSSEYSAANSAAVVLKVASRQ